MTHNPTYIDTFTLICQGSDLSLKFFGFILRYAMLLPDNYFGKFESFITGDEYLARLDDPETGESLRKKQEANKPQDNAFEVYVEMSLMDSTVLFPTELYGCAEYTMAKTREVFISNRSTTHYQGAISDSKLLISTLVLILASWRAPDVTLDFSPVFWGDSLPEISKIKRPKPQKKISNDLVCIDGLVVRGHRMMGPLPEKKVYAVDWRITTGKISGDASPSLLSDAGAYFAAFGFHFDDADNQLSPILTLTDVTCATVRVKEIDLSVWGESSVACLKLEQGFKLHVDNFVTERYCERTVIEVPHLLVRCLAVGETANDEWTTQANNEWVEVFKVTTGINVFLFDKKPDWRLHQARQRRFVSELDAKTQRCGYLFAYQDSDPNSESEGSERTKTSIHSSFSGFDIIHHAPPFVPPFRSTVAIPSNT